MSDQNSKRHVPVLLASCLLIFLGPPENMINTFNRFSTLGKLFRMAQYNYMYM